MIAVTRAVCSTTNSRICTFYQQVYGSHAPGRASTFNCSSTVLTGGRSFNNDVFNMDDNDPDAFEDLDDFDEDVSEDYEIDFDEYGDDVADDFFTDQDDFSYDLDQDDWN
jgi:hypothetical protein